MNLGKSGVGFSAGVKGLRVGVDSRGRKYTSAGIPGTGISTRQYIKRRTEPEPQGRRIVIQPLGWVVIVILGWLLLSWMGQILKGAT